MEVERKWRLRTVPAVKGEVASIAQVYLGSGLQGVHLVGLGEGGFFVELARADGGRYRLRLSSEEFLIARAVCESGASTIGEVRIRCKQGRCYLTIKGVGALSRDENEFEIPTDVYELLAPQCKTRIAKTRTTVEFDSHRFEIDVFEGKLQGLILLEVEFATEAEARIFELPTLFIECGAVDVTNDSRFKNVNLAKVSLASIL